MRHLPLPFLAFALGCNTAGSQAALPDGGRDAATTDATTEIETGPLDAAAEASTPTPSNCPDIDAGVPSPSNDCVYAGHCPASCAGGTASAYLCLTGPDAAGAYPAELDPPSDPVAIVAVQANAYPWEAGAYVSCGPLTCTRWATADHVDGGSSWGGDPCSDGGLATEAWACPSVAGLLPSIAGCFAAGDAQQIGGPGTGIPVDDVWCCPPAQSSPGDAGDAAFDSADE